MEQCQNSFRERKKLSKTVDKAWKEWYIYACAGIVSTPKSLQLFETKTAGGFTERRKGLARKSCAREVLNIFVRKLRAGEIL